MFNPLKWSILALNPCLDRNLYINAPLKNGSLNKVSQTIVNYAGKGLNQSVVAARLGQMIQYFSFGDGQNRSAYEIAAKENFTVHEQLCSCGVRTNIKIIDPYGLGTELNEAGGPITSDEALALISQFTASDSHIFTLGGSIPTGLPKSIYKQIIEEIRHNNSNAIIALDCDGEALKEGIQAGPSLIKPNRRELAGLCELDENDLLDDVRLKKCCQKIFQQYQVNVICTLDADGAVYVGKEGAFRIPAAKVEAKGFSGAGDTFLAGFLTAKISGDCSITEALEFASRSAGAKVALEGSLLPTPSQIESLDKVIVTEW